MTIVLHFDDWNRRRNLPFQMLSNLWSPDKEINIIEQQSRKTEMQCIRRTDRKGKSDGSRSDKLKL